MRRMVTMPAAAYPNLRQLSEILHVPKSTLGDRKVESESVGRERRFAPRTVFTLALYYRRRAVHEVADDLIAFAWRVADESTAQEVEREVVQSLQALQEEPPEARLKELSRKFDVMLERMQDPEYGPRIRQAFDTLAPADFGRAALAAARKRRAAANA